MFAKSINGIGEFYGQRIALLAAYSGISLSYNLKCATFGYPVKATASYNAINTLAEQQMDVQDHTLEHDNVKKLLSNLRLDAETSKFSKTVN
jgi:hypothetical protein